MLSRVLDRYYKAALTKYSTTQHIVAIVSKMAILVSDRKFYESNKFDDALDRLREIHALESGDSCIHYTCVFPAGSSMRWEEKVGFG